MPEDRPSNRFVVEMDGGIPDTTTTTGGEAMAGSNSVTGALGDKGVSGMAGAPGIEAKAAPNQEVVTAATNTSSNANLGEGQQGIGKFDQDPRMNASEMSNVGNARSGVSELPVMKVEGTMRVEFNNAAFKGTIATLVGEVINTAEIVNKLTPALLSRGFLNKDG